MDLRVTGGTRNQGTKRDEEPNWLFRSRRRLATVLVGLLIVWLGFRAIAGPNGWIAYQKKKVEHKQLQQQVQELQRQNEELERRVKALKSDPSTIEKEAREQFGYAKPGETIYVLPEQKSPVSPQSQTGVAQNTEKR